MLIFYDFETTGLNPYHDKITEYSFIKVCSQSLKIIDNHTELVNPLRKLSSKIIKITNITDEMLENKTPFDLERGNNILSFLLKNSNNEDKFFIAHNGDVFDRIFLKEHLKSLGINLAAYNFKNIDTLLFARMMYPQFYKFGLGSLIETFGIIKRKGHRAENDTHMLIDLYIYMCKDLANRNGKNENYYINNPLIVYNMINN